MNGPQHYCQAEHEMERAKSAEMGDEVAYHLGQAQVHATLALVAVLVDTEKDTLWAATVTA